ncbi:hypothetical protein KSP40_PGU021092 [Platanthera guangdongensis]|uniref:Uncharacterized protein n=1 Tax=Platanthera guangdongensis TaxID=2320717 RepID=A0ABR2M5R3_9ASPA
MSRESKVSVIVDSPMIVPQPPFSSSISSQSCLHHFLSPELVLSCSNSPCSDSFLIFTQICSVFNDHSTGIFLSLIMMNSVEDLSNPFFLHLSDNPGSILRDETGIGGSWNDFVRYLLVSLSTGDVKLILDGQANLETESMPPQRNNTVDMPFQNLREEGTDLVEMKENREIPSFTTGGKLQQSRKCPDSRLGVAHASLVVRKSKGLPRISLPLNRLVNLSSKDATANISAALFKAFKNKHDDIVKGCVHSPLSLRLLSLCAFVMFKAQCINRLLAVTS